MTLSSHVTLTTSKADGYVAQLSKHFGHKIVVEQEGDVAVFYFSMGTAQAQAQGDLLVLNAQAETVENLRQVEDIVGAHLERFAFRENLRVTWPDSAGVE